MKSFLLALFLASVSVAAAQQTLTYSSTAETTEGVLSVPQFNPSLGHLIKADLSASIDSDTWITNIPALDATYTVVGNQYYAASVDGVFSVEVASPYSVSFQEGSGSGLFHRADHESGTVRYRGSAVTSWTGTGSLSFPFSTSVECVDFDDLLVSFLVETTATATLSITYTYN